MAEKEIKDYGTDSPFADIALLFIQQKGNLLNGAVEHLIETIRNDPLNQKFPSEIIAENRQEIERLVRNPDFSLISQAVDTVIDLLLCLFGNRRQDGMSERVPLTVPQREKYARFGARIILTQQAVDYVLKRLDNGVTLVPPDRHWGIRARVTTTDEPYGCEALFEFNISARDPKKLFR